MPRPVPAADEVLVEVRAAGINPSEAVIRSGALDYLWPTTFPSGQGGDLAEVVAELGPGISGFAYDLRQSRDGPRLAGDDEGDARPDKVRNRWY